MVAGRAVFAGWVERSDTHHPVDRFRCALPVLRITAHQTLAGLAWDDARSACGTPAPGASSPHKNHRGSAAMSGFSRRDFLSLTGSAAVAGIAGRADAAMGPSDKFDLVIKGGDVLDPSQSLRGK